MKIQVVRITGGGVLGVTTGQDITRHLSETGDDNLRFD